MVRVVCGHGYNIGRVLCDSNGGSRGQINVKGTLGPVDEKCLREKNV